MGLFVSEVKPVRKELSQGDQILEINGEDSRHMTHFEATQLLRSCRDKVHLTVMENGASEYQHFGAATTSIVTVKAFFELTLT